MPAASTGPRRGPLRLAASRLAALDGRHLAVALGGDRPEAVHHAAGARRDQAADDDVLLEPLQVVDLAGDRRLGQDPGGLLERGRRDERLGLQARLGDALQHRLALRRSRSPSASLAR